MTPAAALVRRTAPALIAVAIALVPVIWMASTSVKPPGDYVSTSAQLLPDRITTEHYEALWAEGMLLRLLNSVYVTAGATLLALVVGFLAAYALSRFRMPAHLDVAFLIFVLVVKLMPPIVVAIPLFQILRALGLLDTLTGLVLAYQVYTLPFAIWILLGFVRDVPVAYEEAAALDGATVMQTIRLVVLPIAAPGLIAATVLIAVLAWNEFLFALLFLQTPSKFTLPIYIATFITENETFWGKLMAIGCQASLPLVIGVAYLQRHLLRGFATGL